MSKRTKKSAKPLFTRRELVKALATDTTMSAQGLDSALDRLRFNLSTIRKVANQLEWEIDRALSCWRTLRDTAAQDRKLLKRRRS